MRPRKWSLASLLNYQHGKTRLPRLKCLPSFRLCSTNAHKLFDERYRPRITASMNHSMVSSLRRNHPKQVLGILRQNLQLGFLGNLNEVTLSQALKACRGHSKLGCQIHGFAVTSGFTSVVSVSNAVISMYRDAGEFEKALCVFENLVNPDIVSWNTVLSGYDDNKAALNFVVWMKSMGAAFDAFTYTTAFPFCVDYEGFRFGLQLHSSVMKSCFEADVFVGNALITMYSRWGNFKEAWSVFDEMPNKDLISWNSLLSGLAQGNLGFEARYVFGEMMQEGMLLDHVSITSVLSACCHDDAHLELAKQIHGLCLKGGHATHVSIGNTLMSAYTKCGVVEAAKLVFDQMIERDVVTWTMMISTNSDDAIFIFHKMRLDGVYPNNVTFAALIHAITCRKHIEDGLKIHGVCFKTGFTCDLYVSNCLITMYSEFQEMQNAKRVFDELNFREIISWNALISGFAQNGFSQEALKIFLSAILEVIPNEYTFGSVLNAIATAEDISLNHGQRCHTHIVKMGLDSCPVVSSALLDMYAKRGSINESDKVFNEMSEKNQFAWTSIISAYSRHGDIESVMNLFKEMVKANVEPDQITFLSVLTACSRKGMVDMGYKIFNSMITNYNLQPSQELYSCMVDMLGRAGKLNEAEEMMREIPGGPGLTVLQSMLGSCKIHGDVEMAERVAELLMEMEPEGSGSYVLMSNLYAEKGEWEKVAKIRRGMRKKGVRKEIGFSWVDITNAEESLSLHGFSSGDMTHVRSSEICKMAEILWLEMKFERSGAQESPARACLVFDEGEAESKTAS